MPAAAPREPGPPSASRSAEKPQPLSGPQGFVHRGPGSVALCELAERTRTSPRFVAQRQLAEFIQTSPRVVAQAKRKAELFGLVAQGKSAVEWPREAPAQRKLDAGGAEAGGLPGSLKAGLESLSGMDLSDVRVYRNSDRPAQLNALAYAQGHDIHLGPGQEQHLPHEAWHVVQQRQGRVAETARMAGVAVNDEAGLEGEADLMGGRAVVEGAGTDRGGKTQGLPRISPRAGPRWHGEPEHLAQPSGGAGTSVSSVQLKGWLNSESDKDRFLDALLEAVSASADELLATIGQNSADCPYIAYWFKLYEGEDFQHLRRALIKYVPALATAQTFDEAIEQVVARVRQGLAQNLASGSLDGVPAELPRDLEPARTAPPHAQVMPLVAQRCPQRPARRPAAEDGLAVCRRAEQHFHDNPNSLPALLAWQVSVRGYRDRSGGFLMLPRRGQEYVRDSFATIEERAEPLRAVAEAGERRERARETFRLLARQVPRDGDEPDQGIIRAYTTPDTGKAESHFNKPLRELSMREDQQRDILNLNQALLQSPVHRDGVLWRGTGHLIGGISPDEAELNEIYEEPGFFSTSTSKRIAESFSKQQPLLRITRHRSGRSIISLGGDEYGGGEEEVLFPAGTRFRYLGYDGAEACHDYEEEV